MFPGSVIKDEYDREISSIEMIAIITQRSNPMRRDVPFYYKDWDQFYIVNDAEPGPNGLIRAKIGWHCVGHGDGTWDLITGEFS